MKKIMIAGASMALAAMPVLGAFAANEAQDTLNVNVPNGCTLATRANGEATWSSVAPNTDGEAKSTAAMVITCNNSWSVTPHSTGLAYNSNTITSNATGGDTSTFKLMLTPTGSEYTGAAGGNGGVVTNDFLSANTIDGTHKISGNAAATAVSITPTYTVHISTVQEPGLYTGTVYYDIATL